MCNWTSMGRDCKRNGVLVASRSFSPLGFSSRALEYRSKRNAAACVFLCNTSFLVRVYRRSSSKRMAVPRGILELSLE